LLQDVSRFSQSMAERPMQVEHAWRPHLEGQLAHQRQAHRRNATSFYSTCEQFHELRAEGSGRHQQGEIDPCLLHAHPNFARRGCVFLRVLCQRKAIVLIGHPSDDSFAR